MNKGDLINEVAKVVSTKKEAQAAVECVFSTISEHSLLGQGSSLLPVFVQSLLLPPSCMFVSSVCPVGQLSPLPSPSLVDLSQCG